jgi:hypothetical protein
MTAGASQLTTDHSSWSLGLGHLLVIGTWSLVIPALSLVIPALSLVIPALVIGHFSSSAPSSLVQ